MMRVFLFLFFITSTVYAQEGLRDIQPPVAYPINYYFWGCMVLGILILFSVAYILVKKYNPSYFKKEKVVIRRTPFEIADEALQNLLSQDLIKYHKIKTFYSTLSDIVRVFIEGEFHLRAPEMTTQEFLEYVRYSDALKVEQKKKLSGFLNCCDMVKFAKYSPSDEEYENILEIARQFIDASQKVIITETGVVEDIHGV